MLVKKAAVEGDEKEQKKVEKKVSQAEKAVKQEEKEVQKEVKAEKVAKLENEEAQAEKKADDKKKNVPYKTLPAKDVEIKSDNLKDDCAGHYRQSKDHVIHDHPVWIKVKPAPGYTRFGWYQDSKWHISDIAHLKTMLDE